MPSARDLMQKADALMRSNRHLGASGSGSSDQDIPVLTDIVIAGDATVLRHDQPTVQRVEPKANAQSMPVEPLIPQRRDAMAPREAQPDQRAERADGVDESQHLADEVARLAAQREAEKRDLAESVYFEVLRDLDVDTIDGMRERISAQLMPVFEQMGRDLVNRAEQALSEAIRDQVAAAIERRVGVSPDTRK